MSRRIDSLRAEYERGAGDAKNGTPPDPSRPTTQYGYQTARMVAEKYAYEAGYYTTAAAEYRKGMLENGALYADALDHMAPGERSAFLEAMWAAFYAKGPAR